MFDFRRITLFCLEKRLSKHKMTIFSKNFEGHGPFGAPLATLMLPLQTGKAADMSELQTHHLDSEPVFCALWVSYQQIDNARIKSV